MSGLSFRPLALAMLAASALGVLALPASAGAAITIGPDLSTPPTTTFICNISGGCTYSQGSPTYTSPISGTVVGWIVRGSNGPLTLRIISGNTGGASSEVRNPPTTGVQSFPTSLPIKAGDRIGVDLPTGLVSNIGVRQPTGPSIDQWTPSLGNGQTRTPLGNANNELLLDAVIKPSSAFSLGSAIKNKKKGTAEIDATVPGPGVVDLSGAGIRSAQGLGARSSVTASGPGIVKLIVKAKGKAKKRLKRTGKAKVTASVTYTPTGGDPNTQSELVKLKKKR